MDGGDARAVGNVRLCVYHQTSLIPGDRDARGAFESLWSRLPPFVEDNSFCAVASAGGVFLKGQRLRTGGGLTSLRQARRLAREVVFLRRMRAAGVPVPEVLAWGVQRRLGVSVRSLLLLRLIDGARDLREVIRASEPADREDLWEPVGEVVRRLHRAGLFHRDLTARNVLVARGQSGVDVHLIDCPRAESGNVPLRRSFLRRADLFRLGRSILKAGGTDDEVRATLAAAATEDVAEMLSWIRRGERRRSFRTQLWIAFGV